MLEFARIEIEKRGAVWTCYVYDTNCESWDCDYVGVFAEHESARRAYETAARNYRYAHSTRRAMNY